MSIFELTTGPAASALGGTELVPISQSSDPAAATVNQFRDYILANNMVSMAKLADIASDRLIGRDTGGTGDPEALTVGGGIEFTGAGGIQTSAFTGDVTKTGGGTVLTIAANVVTLAKFQQIATDRLLGRDATGTGNVQELTVSSGLEFSGSNGIQRSALTGDVTATAGSNATTIANDAVTFAKMANLASDRLIGRDTASSGDPESITVGGGIEFTGSGGIQTSAFTGDVTKSTGGTATTIANDAVTYAKMQNVSAASKLLGRGSAGGAGDPQEITLGTNLSMSGTTLNASGGSTLPFVTLTSAGGVADAQQIANKASGAKFSISSGSATLTATGVSPFVAGDVGKTIVVTGAGSGGAKLTTTIAAVTSSTVITLTASASTTVSSGSEKGLTWGTPAQTALASAFATVLAAGGGAVVIDGAFMLTGATTVSTSSVASMVGMIGFGSGSRLYICCGTTVDAITINSAQHHAVVDGVTFVGTTGEVTDAARVLVFGSCWKAIVRNCGFYGLGTSATSPSIIRCVSTSYLGEDNFFGGCGATTGSGLCAVVDHVTGKGAIHDREKYIDYGQLGSVLHEKVSTNVTNAWVLVRDHVSPDPPVAMLGDNRIEFRNLNLDEGTTYGLAVLGSSGRIGRVLIEGIEENVGNADTARGFFLINVDDAIIRHCWFGYASNANTYFGGLQDCGRVLIDACVCGPTLTGAATVMDTLLCDNVDDLTIKDTAIVAFDSLNDPGNAYQTRYHPIDSRYFPYAMIKATGAVTDADFAMPPARGTRGLTTSTGVEYVKKLKTEGWLEYASTNSPLYGSELVTNGDGSSTAGWTAVNASASLSGGALRVTNTGASTGYLYQLITVEAGEPYEFDIDIIPGTGTGRCRIGAVQTDNAYGEYTSTPGSPLVFVPSTNQVAITIYVDDSTSGHNCDYDNITLRAT